MSAETKSVGKWISFLHRQFQVYINHEMKPYNINSSEYIYLAELGKDEGVNQSYFTESLSIDPALTTRVMKTLEEKGFITRTKDEHDKRAVLIHLTEEGRRIQPILIEKLTNWTNCLTSDFTEDEHESIYQSLIKMSSNVANRKETMIQSTKGSSNE